MELEKSETISWSARNNIQFRVKRDRESSLIWVSIEFHNLALPLLMYDFIDRIEQELHLDVNVDTSWNEHRGFSVKNKAVDLLLGEIIAFTTKWKVEPDEHGDTFTSQEWYSE